MKKYLIPFLIFYHLVSTAQVAKEQSDFIQTGAFEVKIANIGPGCRIKMDLPQGVKLGQSYKSNSYRGRAGFAIKMPPNFSNDGQWGFDFKCYKTNEKQFQDTWKDRSPKDGTNFAIEGDTKIFTDEEGVTYTPVQSVNAHGWALIFDDTTGEERFRSRYFWYCIKAEESAICGSSNIGYIDFLENKKNIDVTSYAFRILESIEFLEDAVPN